MISVTYSDLKPSRIGILLLDPKLRLIHCNAEAASILTYPKKPQHRLPLDAVLPATRSQIAGPPDPGSASGIEFFSGRRRYLCRAFLLDSPGSGATHAAASVVVLLERVCTESSFDITRWSEQFQLTTRERETVALLLKGLTSKEIAGQMRISPNTVKTFLKLVMAKVGASNRTGIVAKILERAS